ncbi:MAG TPA: hypothetical protein VGC45_11930 [Gryllotalpicola sp.]
MSFAEYSALPVILDIDMKLQDGWRQVVPGKPAQPWARQLAKQLAGRHSRAVRAGLEADLVRVHEDFAALDDPYGRFAVRVPDGDPRVRCMLFYRPNFALDESSPLYTIDAYEKDLRVPDSEPGASVDVVKVWRESLPLGEYTGQYSIVHYQDLQTGDRHDEERVAIGVFPTGASQALEIAFTTPEVGANGDGLVDLVRASLQTLTVTLGPDPGVS